MEGEHMHGQTCRRQRRSMEFQPFTHYGYAGMMPQTYQFARQAPAHTEMMSSYQEVSGYSSDDQATALKPEIAKLSPFAKKWFDLDQAKRKELRKMKEKWIASQHESGKVDREKYVDGMKTVMPKFAAKWLSLSEDEKKQYRSFKGQQASGSVPPFAAKWFELPEGNKKEYRKLNMKMKATKKAWASDGDQSEPEADLEHTCLPKFATKWLELPQQKRNAIRIKYRHAQKCHEPNCDGLKKMLAMMQSQNRCGQHSSTSRPHQIQMSEHGPTAPMTWMGHGCVKPKHPMCVPSQFSHMRGHCMGVPPFVMMKRHMSKARQSDESTSDSSSSDDEATDVPPFVKKWFALPMEARQHLRMMKQHQMKHGKSAADGIPPFAKKWFVLPEKKKQHWRKFHCVQKKRTSNAEATSPLRCDDVGVDGVTVAAVPEFAQKWFALPMQRKHYLRMLNKYLSAKDQDESGTSEDEEYSETMPEFAAKWFSLSSEERQRLKHNQEPKQDRCKRKAHKSFGKFGASPCQHWAYHTMPPMGYFCGFTHAAHIKESDDKFTESDSDN